MIKSHPNITHPSLSSTSSVPFPIPSFAHQIIPSASATQSMHVPADCLYIPDDGTYYCDDDGNG